MHTRRIATFLLGGWIGCSLLMVILYWMNLRFADILLAAPVEPAAKIVDLVGHEPARLLLRHFAAEQNRHYFYVWEEAQIVLGLVLTVFLVLGTQKRIFPIALCGLMLVLVIFQHFTVNPELSYRGRHTDFPPNDSIFGEEARLWALTQLYAGTEALKLFAGGLLASYLFVFRARRPRREKVDAVDHAHHGHVDG